MLWLLSSHDARSVLIQMTGDEVCRIMRARGYDGVIICVSGNAFRVRDAYGLVCLLVRVVFFAIK